MRLNGLRIVAGLTETILRRKYAATMPNANEQELLREEFGNAEANELFHKFIPHVLVKWA